MIAVRSLSKSFGGQQVLDRVDCEFSAGRVTGLVGRNGSGKSTLLNCLSCRLRPDSGKVELFGHEVPIEEPWRRARRGLAATFQEPRSTDDLRLSDLLTIAESNSQQSPPCKPFAGARNLLEPELFGVSLSSMSYGQRKIANLLVALAMRPRIILLDEPVAGLAPGIVQIIGRIMAALAETGVAVVVIEHDFDFLKMYCGSVYLLHEGRILLGGSPDEVFPHDLLLRAFR